MKVVVYDASYYAGWVGNTWVAGGRLYRALRKVDLVIPVLFWNQVYSELQRLPDFGITDLQFWCHGYPGGVVINNEAAAHDRIDSRLWKGIAAKIAPTGRVWFRSCSTFARRQGQEFAQNLANTMDRRVVGHTYLTGVFQSGLHGLRPGEDVRWSEMEGVRVRKDNTVELKTSGPFEPNTVTCLHTDF